MTTTARRIKETGSLFLTCGVQHYLETGCLPYATEEHNSQHTESWRRHFIAVAWTSHMSGSWGDTCADDAAMNDEVYRSADGGRLMSSWERSGFPKLWIITDAYGSPDAYSTILFPCEY